MAQIHTVLFLSFLSKCQLIVLLFIQHHKYTNEFTEQMHGLVSLVCTTFHFKIRHNKLVNNKAGETGYTYELEKDREIAGRSALVGFSPYQSTPYNSVLSLGRAEQENPATSRNGWHKHRKKVVTSSPGQRKWPATLICLTDVPAWLFGMGTAAFLPCFMVTCWWWALKWCLE